MKNKQSGFSLIELLLVVVCIGIISAIAVPSLLKARDVAQKGSTTSTMRTLSTLQLRFFSEHNRYGRLSELNAGQDIRLGTSCGNCLVRSNFTYTMNPANPTDQELAKEYKIVATRPGRSGEPPTILEVDQTGTITGIAD